jgi:hypothetical protein
VKKTLFTVLLLVFSLASVSALYAADSDVKIVDYTNSVAQNLAGKFGLGLNFVSYRGFEGDKETPAVNVRYWIDDNVGIEGILGFSSGEFSYLYYIGGKLVTIVKNIKSLNVYASFFGGFGEAKNSRYDEDAAYIYKIGAGLGIEWFVLDCLSISSELGLALSSNSNSNVGNSFGIYGDWLPQAGIKLYF